MEHGDRVQGGDELDRSRSGPHLEIVTSRSQRSLLAHCRKKDLDLIIPYRPAPQQSTQSTPYPFSTPSFYEHQCLHWTWLANPHVQVSLWELKGRGILKIAVSYLSSFPSCFAPLCRLFVRCGAVYTQLPTSCILFYFPPHTQNPSIEK